MAVRPAQSSDMAELMRMAKEIHYAHGAKRWVLFEDNIAEWMMALNECIESHGGDKLIYVVEQEPGKLVGFVTAVVGPVFWGVGNTKIAYEQLIWVDEEHRGSAFGKELIEQLCSDAKQLGCTDVFIGVSCRFPGAKKIGSMYRDLGFKLEERHFSRRL